MYSREYSASYGSQNYQQTTKTNRINYNSDCIVVITQLVNYQPTVLSALIIRKG